MTLLTLLLTACLPSSAPPLPCEDITATLERDLCLGERIASRPASELEQVQRDAAQVSDPVVRGSAVMRWVGAHNRALNPQQVLPLCDSLGGRDRGACHRRVQSAHLNR